MSSGGTVELLGPQWLIHSAASNSMEAAKATRGETLNQAHQLSFTGSAATRARTRTSNSGEGSITGSSPSNPDTARNSFTRTEHGAHEARCFSTSRRSLSFSRPSRYSRIRLSIFVQLITAFFPYPTALPVRHERG